MSSHSVRFFLQNRYCILCLRQNVSKDKNTWLSLSNYKHLTKVTWSSTISWSWTNKRLRSAKSLSISSMPLWFCRLSKIIAGVTSAETWNIFSQKIKFSSHDNQLHWSHTLSLLISFALVSLGFCCPSIDKKELNLNFHNKYHYHIPIFVSHEGTFLLDVSSGFFSKSFISILNLN